MEIYPVPKKIKPIKSTIERARERRNKQIKQAHEKLQATYIEREIVRNRDGWKCVNCGKDYSKEDRKIARKFLIEVHHVMGRLKKYLHDIRFMVCVCGWQTDECCHPNVLTKPKEFKRKFLLYLIKFYPEIAEDTEVQKILDEKEPI